MTATITLTTAGLDTGPFLLFSDLDGFTSAFESGIPKGSFNFPGYTTSLVPDGTEVIRVMSDNVDCGNYLDMPIIDKVCNCVTLISGNSLSTNYTYKTCATGELVSGVLDAFATVSFCGTDPTVDREGIDIIFGGSCSSNDDCKS